MKWNVEQYKINKQEDDAVVRLPIIYIRHMI